VNHNSATSAATRHLRKRKKKEAFEYTAFQQQEPYFPTYSNSTIATAEREDENGDADALIPPPVPILSNLEMCLMENDYIMDYSSSKDIGSNDARSTILVSNIPVPTSAFNNGIFIQNVEENDCYDEGSNVDNAKLRVYCEQVGHVYCKYCVFDESLMRTASILDLDHNFSSLLPKCRDEVTKIAGKCKETDCINVRPLATVDHQSHTNSNNGLYHQQRNLLQDDDVLGHDKSRWMTSLGAKLGAAKDRVILADFVLPGSHNSAAAKMSDKFCSESNALSSLVSDARDKVAKCQDSSIWDQLESGIRYFDIRVVDAAKVYNLRYPLHHSFLIDNEVNTMEKVLETLSRFVDKNPGEFLIARIKTTVCQIPSDVSYGGWKDEFHRLRNKFPRVQVYNIWTKFIGMTSLQGYVYVDIDDINDELYTSDSGVDGLDYSIGNGNPFEIANNIRESGFKQDDLKFNVWSFFPAPSLSQLVWAISVFTHNGLEDWDANFQNHVWLMHTLIAHEGFHVNAILRDRATTRRNIYHVATQLTQYRIFEKLKDTLPDLDTVASHEYVNEFNEKFEHRCPVGWILGGAMSIHNNHKEDRVWKFSCIRVNWVGSKSLWYDYNLSRWRSDLHDNIWRPNTEFNTINNWDSELNYGWYDCNRAITGIGGVHNNRREDRKFWLYSSDIIGPHSPTCQWTGWVNGWDGQMDTSLVVNQYIGAVYSVHNNRKEDRRWQFCLCTKYSTIL